MATHKTGQSIYSFDFSALYGIAKASGLNALITTDSSISELAHVFPFLKTLKSDERRPGVYFPKFREHKAYGFDLRAFSLNYMKDIELLGLFQSWRYFDHVRAEIRQQFAFSRSAVGLVQTFLHEATANVKQTALEGGTFDADFKRFPLTYVGVHVRRMGYDTQQMRDLGYKSADLNYIYAAMHYFRHKYKNVIFIVTSDDLQWCQQNVNAPNNVVVYSNFKHHGLDMCLLTQCNHTITTTGAFSWWAGWLSGGTVLYYKDHPVPKSELAKEFKAVDYFPTDWLPIMS